MALPEGEAHIWLATPDSLDQGADLLRWLEPSERAQHDRFHFERDRRLHRTAHALLRGLLGRYGALEPARWRFSKGPYGRPEIAPEHPWLRFNISHTRGLVAVALARRLQIGVDVEEVVAARATDDLAAYVFSPDELAGFRALGPAEQVARFFTLWTCKEAYIKGRGMGLQLPLDQFTVSFGEPVQLAVDPAIDDGRPWRLHHRDLGEHHLAVAVDADAEIVVRWARPALVEA